MKNALLIISHGSSRAAANAEVADLTARVQASAEGLAVECAFLEISEPTVQQKIDALADSGVTDIQVFPHFLAAGAHVSRDIPREIQAAQEKHPTIQFTQLPHLGALSELPELITQSIETH